MKISAANLITTLESTDMLPVGRVGESAPYKCTVQQITGATPKATGAEVTTGTNNNKFITPKALADAGITAGGGGGGSSAFSLLPNDAELVGASGEPILVSNHGTYFNYTELQFANGTSSIQTNWIIPATTTSSIDGDITIKIAWKTPSTTTGQHVQWQIQLGNASGSPFDSALSAAILFPISSPLGTAEQEIITELTLTAANLISVGLVADDDWVVMIVRDPTHTNDTLADTANLIRVSIYPIV